MQFINKTFEEEAICKNSSINNRKNSLIKDYFNMVNDKPWGKEYLAYQNKYIGIWILHINKQQETSLHSHFKKDTILIPLNGSFKINLYNSYKILNILNILYVPRNVFHGIHSYGNDGILMEIEIYTEYIQYTDKNDLLRIKDLYIRDKNNYETSIIERIPKENELIMNFHNNNNYYFHNTELSIFNLNNFDEVNLYYDKIILLEGCLYIDEKRITSGSFINLDKKYSFLTEEIKILCISNINKNNLNKIIYSKDHLTDYLKINNLTKIGLTSGCFDILHEGHITNLKKCKNYCDNLFVCLSSDEQIKRIKGINRPINNIIDRTNMLINFEFIDLLILYDEINDDLETELDNIMNIVNPYCWFKGSDYTKEGILKKHPTLKHIELINLIQGKSTTNIIKKIKY